MIHNPGWTRTRPPLRAMVLAGIALLGACSTPPRPTPESMPTPASTRRWPRTVAEAVELELRTMSDGEKAAIRQTARDRVQDAYHGFQMMHRADFGLSEGNDELLASCGSVRTTAEDCMRIILDALWVALQGKAGPPVPHASDRR